MRGIQTCKISRCASSMWPGHNRHPIWSLVVRIKQLGGLKSTEGVTDRFIDSVVTGQAIGHFMTAKTIYIADINYCTTDTTMC